MRLSTASLVFDLRGVPKGSRSGSAGSMSCWLSCLSGRDSLFDSEVFVLNKELVLAPMMWLVFFLGE